MNSIREWMEGVSGPGWIWYVKYLSGNDTLLNESHQAGPYIPKRLIFRLFPSLYPSSQDNPRAEFGAAIDSHSETVTPTAIWYNNRLRGGTRNECRITNWGGRSSPLLDPDSTGSLCIFAFHQNAPDRDVEVCRIWLCRNLEEEDAALDRVGPVEPGVGTLYEAGQGEMFRPLPAADAPCRLTPDQVPEAWRLAFPEAQAIVDFAIQRLPTAQTQPPDTRLLRRRECEFAIFRSVEEAVVMPRIREGFATVDIFVDFANSVTNRRKSRSGASLELHTRRVFDEEGLTYAHDEVSEGGKRPDFLFPHLEAYRDPTFPAAKLRMLGVKTTCKDRWRQILNEADRIPRKHLLTLQEGVSLSQWNEMQTEGVSLVVPAALHDKYHETIRPSLLTLEQFIRGTLEGCS